VNSDKGWKRIIVGEIVNDNQSLAYKIIRRKKIVFSLTNHELEASDS
jgi:hypothetical protein